MIEEDYVSAEVARLLKEKGFNQPLLTFYVCVDNNYSNEVDVMVFTDDTIENNSDLYVLAPTLQMAMKWLREIHNLNIEIDTIGRKDKNTLSWRSTVYNLNNQYECYYNETCESYEQACDEAIKYCLETLI